MVKLSIPYNKELSKNRMWLKKRGGGVYLNLDTVAEQEAIAVQIQAAQIDWKPKSKLWVRIMVYRPHLLGDPANFVDTILDAVQEGTGVNDRYYSGSWDWIVDKDNPRIEITVEQEEV